MATGARLSRHGYARPLESTWLRAPARANMARDGASRKWCRWCSGWRPGLVLVAAGDQVRRLGEEWRAELPLSLSRASAAGHMLASLYLAIVWGNHRLNSFCLVISFRAISFGCISSFGNLLFGNMFVGNLGFGCLLMAFFVWQFSLQLFGKRLLLKGSQGVGGKGVSLQILI